MRAHCLIPWLEPGSGNSRSIAGKGEILFNKLSWRLTIIIQPGIGNPLKCFHSFLQDRQAKLVDCDLEITKLSGELQDKIESWIGQGSGFVDLRGTDKPPLDTAYVLSCPQMHVVPEIELRTFVANRRPVCNPLLILTF